MFKVRRTYHVFNGVIPLMAGLYVQRMDVTSTKSSITPTLFVFPIMLFMLQTSTLWQNVNVLTINKHLSLMPQLQQRHTTGSPNESWHLLRAQIIWAAVPINRGPRPYQTLFSLWRGERRKRERDLKNFHIMLFKQSASNLGSKSNPAEKTGFGI